VPVRMLSGIKSASFISAEAILSHQTRAYAAKGAHP
jgi:hypothetical protein